MPKEEKGRAVDVVLPYRLKPLTYRFKETIPKGVRVLVPFKNTQKIGLVWGEATFAGDLKEITEVIDGAPLVPERLLSFLKWVADYHLAPEGEVIRCAIPASFFRLPKRRKIEKIEEIAEQVPLSPGYHSSLYFFEKLKLRAEKLFEKVKTSLEKGPVLFLVPDRELLFYYAEILKKMSPLLYYGDLTPAKRKNMWLHVLKGDARLVIGTRLALFLPFKNLSLIVVEEEENQGYKQEEGFRANFRDLALMRAKLEETEIVLASGAPSVKSYYFAKTGRYGLSSGKKPQGEIKLVDLRENKGLFSQKLINALRKTLARNKQALLFLNIKGYAPHVLCETCGHVFDCPRCHVPLHYFKTKGMLKCPYCAYKIKGFPLCPSCSGEVLKTLGVGTERLEEICAKFFPQARLARLESEEGDFSPEETDILICTAKVGRFSPLPRLGLVAVVLADQLLSQASYLAAEKSYQLLKKLSLIAHNNEKFEFLVQTYRPFHHVFAGLKEGYEAFFVRELEFRHLHKFPPFGRVAELILATKREILEEIPAFLEPLFLNMGLEFIGPLFKSLRGKEKLHYLVVAERSQELHEELLKVENELKSRYGNRLRLVIDMSPL
ncbi:replication restart helicase PriA [Thermodesulfatator atlanticus]|uniref:replication restart helicase PriA n=1 Tax=Thermodesulfatator atlanticus TaxID=501497 RepID=UPI0003B34DA2|nr:primosomal protein N' [Thermodesulfatator atlanticus]